MSVGPFAAAEAATIGTGLLTGLEQQVAVHFADAEKRNLDTEVRENGGLPQLAVA
jgi:hypothetical protein